MNKLIVFLISLYQKTLSPDHSWVAAYYPDGYCRFTPSCSEYSKQAFLKYNFFKAFYLSSRRVVRCNPWGNFGPDPLL